MSQIKTTQMPLLIVKIKEIKRKRKNIFVFFLLPIINPFFVCLLFLPAKSSKGLSIVTLRFSLEITPAGLLLMAPNKAAHAEVTDDVTKISCQFSSLFSIGSILHCDSSILLDFFFHLFSKIFQYLCFF